MSEKKLWPNFFIVGVPKSGTTSLYNYLNEHKKIFMSPIKEPHYFDTDIATEEFAKDIEDVLNYQEKIYKKEKKAHLAFIRNKNQYIKLFSKGKNLVKGEATTYYLFSKVAAKNIFKVNKDAKIIIILRNPIDRAISHYKMDIRTGKCKLSFSEKIDKDLKVYKNKKHKPGYSFENINSYIELGLYYEQLKRYFNVFPEENISILIFEKFINNINDYVNKQLQFLGLKPLKETTNEDKYNKANFLRYRRVMYYLRKLRIKSFFSYYLPDKLKNKIKEIFYISDKSIKVNAEDYEKLRKIFFDDVKKTGNLIKKDILNYWFN